MGLLGRLFGKREDPPKEESASANMAFVLLSEARLPAAEEVAGAFGTFAPPDEILREEAGEEGRAGRCRGRRPLQLLGGRYDRS